MWNVNNQSWDIHSRRPLRDRKALQWRTIQSSLPPLIDNLHKDQPTWKPSNDSSFAIKYVIQINASPASNSEFAVHLMKLWKSKVPKK